MKYDKKTVYYLRKKRSSIIWSINWNSEFGWWSFKKLKGKNKDFVDEHIVTYKDIDSWVKYLTNSENKFILD